MKPASISAPCPDCGLVSLTANDLIVRMCADDDTNAYVFRCPKCDLRTAKQCSRRVVDLLLECGVRVQVWRLPAELSEPRPAGPTITPDDVLDFHLLLLDETWCEHTMTTLEATGTK